jgi:thiamine kinase-like enzyme
MTVLHTLKELTADWLTNVLHEKGVLEYGQVVRVTSSRTTHQSSLNYFLRVKYSPDAPKTAPKTLFLKLSRPERLPLTADEVEYYTKILAQMPYKITPTCYAAEFDSDKGAYHILMEDVSATHTSLGYQIPPSPEQALQMARTLARLHAYWWEKPNLNTVSDLPTETVIKRYVEKCLPGLSPMFDFLGDRLTQQQKSRIEKLIEQYPRWMITRTQQTPNHLTLIHGDAHNANFLLPKTNGETYLIDRQPFDWSLTCWLGVSDLTYMMVHWWYPSYRQRVEETVLRAYHAELVLCGVENYDWEQLWQDYRLCAIQSLYVPLAWCALESAEKVASAWYPLLMYTLDALEQLASNDIINRVL